MTGFRFPLQRVLEWRQTQFEVEKSRLHQAVGELAELDRERASLEAAGVRAELDVRGQASVKGGDLAALSGFRQHVRKREGEIARQRIESVKRLEAQQAVVLEARRRCRLLERLRDRRMAEWKAAGDRELEQLAAESFLARRHREHTYNEVHDA